MVELLEDVPTAHNAAKYDRQLRLWGDQGQKCLENAKVCLINAAAPGVETLKNLVLPGIGSFTIVDNQNISNQELGTNFFVTLSDVGKNRGDVCCANLLELNPDVRGSSVNESFESLISKDSGFFDNFSLVILCMPIEERSLSKLGTLLWNLKIPLIILRCCGLWACLRTVVNEHYVIEAHPEGVLFDLRLDKLHHVPGLQQFVNEQDLDTMTREQHMHTPYLVLIIKFLQKWYEREQSQELPKNYRERQRFQKLLAEGIRPREGNNTEDEENFAEGIKAVNTVFNPTVVPAQIQRLFEDKFCTHLTAESSNFWIIIRALKEYTLLEGEGCLPVNGSIPDMTSDSQRYVKLQTLYQDASKNAASAVYRHVQEILRSLGKSTESIKASEVRRYCKSATHLDCISCKPLEAETVVCDNIDSTEECSGSSFIKRIENAGENDPTSLLNLYLLFLASDEFYQMYRRYPGDIDSSELDSDIAMLKNCLSNTLSKLNPSTSSPAHYTIPDELVSEMVRYGGSVMHSMASFIGGVASHEIIKLLTNQYVPFHDVFIYNGISCISESFKL